MVRDAILLGENFCKSTAVALCENESRVGCRVKPDREGGWDIVDWRSESVLVLRFEEDCPEKSICGLDLSRGLNM